MENYQKNLNMTLIDLTLTPAQKHVKNIKRCFDTFQKPTE